MRSQTTIHDLAQRCGVSIATVSRALNGQPGVGDATRKRILELANEVDYRPSAAARTLVTRRSQILGVVLDTGAGHPSLQHPFFQHVLVGFQSEAHAQSFDLLLFARDRTSTGAQTRLLNRCRQHRIDGIAVIALDLTDPGEEALAMPGIPCVALDIDVDPGTTAVVSSDNAGGAALATRHLHELGRRRIAMIAGNRDSKPGRERLQGYLDELARLGVPRRDELIRGGDFYSESGGAEMAALLALPEPPDAVFAATDLMAAGALQAARAAGVRVPEEIAIVGFDGLKLTSLTHPRITTVRQDKRGLGVVAARTLLQMLADPSAPPPAVRLPVQLVVRESSAGAAAPPPSEEERSEPSAGLAAGSGLLAG